VYWKNFLLSMIDAVRTINLSASVRHLVIKQLVQKKQQQTNQYNKPTSDFEKNDEDETLCRFPVVSRDFGKPCAVFAAILDRLLQGTPGVDRIIWSGKTGGPKPESVPMENAPKWTERRKGEFYGKFRGGRSRPSLE
jgi:hypothetical protein